MDQQSSTSVNDLESILESLVQNASAQEKGIAPGSSIAGGPKKAAPINVTREKKRVPLTDEKSVTQALDTARRLCAAGNFVEGIDLYEQLVRAIPQFETDLLAELYDQYQRMPQNRYSLYVSRDYDFKIQPGAKVLDIGSGHDPFPFATHLADIAPDDDSYGRAGIPIKQIEGKPFYACSVEDMPFKDKEFDFVYCSHVLEHVDDPRRACRELARVAKRGYIETPNIGKDIWLNTAKISNHHWYVENLSGKLIFTRYPEHLLDGIGSNILMSMHCQPQTPREKAFSALVLLRSAVINTNMYWENEIVCEVRN